MGLAAGTKLGPYEIVSPLGAGGMGEVYRARDARIDRTVAVKILPAHLSEKPEARERFEREARAISQLSHANICQLYDLGQQDGIHYIVMECLEGETLASRLAKGRLPIEQVLRYGAGIAEGLDQAHRSGVVHRDLKPGNIMLTRSGAKLMDFGLAKTVVSATPQSSGLSATLTSAASHPLTPKALLWGPSNTCPPNRWKARTPTRAATSSASEPCSTRWPPASELSRARASSRLRPRSSKGNPSQFPCSSRWPRLRCNTSCRAR